MTGEAVVAGAGMMAFERHADRTLRPLAAKGICTAVWNGRHRERHVGAVAQRTGYVVSSGSGPRPGLPLDYSSCGGRLGRIAAPERSHRPGQAESPGPAIGHFSRLHITSILMDRHFSDNLAG